MKDYLLGAENTVMKKLKIAVDARTLGSRPSGVGMYLNDFLEQLITYDEFEWILFTDVKESEYIKRFEARGIKVIEWGKPVYRSAGVYAYFAFIKKELKQVIDWSRVDKEDYLLAMERSPIKDIEIKFLLKNALTDNVNDREIYMKGIDHSYYYEGYYVFKMENLTNTKD